MAGVFLLLRHAPTTNDLDRPAQPPTSNDGSPLTDNHSPSQRPAPVANAGDDSRSTETGARAQWLARVRRLVEARTNREQEETAAPVGTATGTPSSNPAPSNTASSNAAPSTAAADQDPTGTLPAEVIRQAMDALRPLFGECYDLALEEDPTLSGQMVVNFLIGGEPEVGGVVEDVAIAAESDVMTPTLDECISETIYTLELEAPEQGGQVRVTYPFYFSSFQTETPPEGPTQDLRAI